MIFVVALARVLNDGLEIRQPRRPIEPIRREPAVNFRQAARLELEEARGENYKYTSLLGDRKPPFVYRK